MNQKRKPPRIPVISSSLVATGTVGTAFSYQIVASNNPTSYTASGLPTGLNTNSTTGLISGTPASGTDPASPYGVILGARNNAGTGRATLKVTIKAAVPPPVTTAPAYVTWTQIANATGYKIFWGKNSGSYGFSNDCGNVTQYKVPNLTVGTTYYFSGKSYNASDISPFGYEVEFVP